MLNPSKLCFRTWIFFILFPVILIITQSLTANEVPVDTTLLSHLIKRPKENPVISDDSALYYYGKTVYLAKEGLKQSKATSFRKVLLGYTIKGELGLGLIYYRNVDYKSAMQHFDQAYLYAKTLNNSYFLAECLFNYGEVYLEQSRYTMAMTSYFEAMQHYSGSGDNQGIYWCYNGMGIAQKQCGNFNDAIICYDKALSISRKAGMKLETAYCLNNLANVYRKQGNFLKAMDTYEKALSCFNEMKDDLSASDCLNNIGNLYLDKGDPFRALDYYNRAINFEKVKADNYRMISRYKNLADAYTALKDNTNASMFLDKAVKLAEKSEDKLQLASCYSQIGSVHLMNGSREVAISYFKKSVEMFEKVGAKAEEAEVLVDLANAELISGKIEDAIIHAEAGEKKALEVGAIKTVFTSNDCLSKLWEKKGDPKRSLGCMKKALQFKDSVFSIEKNRAIEEIEAGFTRNRLENENQILTQNSKLQQQSIKIRNIAMISLVLCLVLSFMVIWLVFKRHKDARSLALREKALKQKEIEKLNEDLLIKERELTSKTIFISQKNTLLQNLIQELEQIKDASGTPATRIEHLQHELKQELSPNAWKEFEIQFNDVHPGFQNRLLERFPELTPGERRLCAFLRLDMNTREIASLTGQTFKSIEVARTRIRKKMGLPREDNLINFIALL